MKYFNSIKRSISCIKLYSMITSCCKYQVSLNMVSRLLQISCDHYIIFLPLSQINYLKVLANIVGYIVNNAHLQISRYKYIICNMRLSISALFIYIYVANIRCPLNMASRLLQISLVIIIFFCTTLPYYYLKVHENIVGYIVNNPHLSNIAI